MTHDSTSHLLLSFIMSFRPILQLMLLALSCNQAFSWIVTCPINDKRSTPPQRSSHLEGRCIGGGRIHHCWHNNNEKISSVQQPSLGRRGRRNGLHVEAVSSGQVEVLSSAEIPVVIPSLLLVFAALGIGIAAQSLINQQLKGDQGLSAFLKDGSGYSKSAFRPIVDNDRAVSQGDPLPSLAQTSNLGFCRSCRSATHNHHNNNCGRQSFDHVGNTYASTFGTQ